MPLSSSRGLRSAGKCPRIAVGDPLILEQVAPALGDAVFRRILQDLDRVRGMHDADLAVFEAIFRNSRIALAFATMKL